MGPFIKSNNSTTKIMRNVMLSLLPLILFVIYKHGYVPYVHNKVKLIGVFYPLFFIIAGALTSFLIEFVYYKFIKKCDDYRKSYSFFSGLFLSLILPFKTPIYILVIGATVASLSKIIFGGFGKNIFNPALIGYIFVVTSYSFVFSTDYYFNSYELDTISSSTPLTNASMISSIGDYDKLVKPYGSLFNFFIGMIPGSLAETSSLLCIVAFIYLAITKTIKWRIPTTYILTVFILTFGIGRLLGQGIYYPIFHILSGGLLFGAVFMATDPVTSAVTPVGQILQGILLGMLTMFFRFTGVEGVATSILILNMFVFIIDKIGVKARFNFSKFIPWIIVICVMFVVSIIGLASTKRVVGNQDPNFKIINKTKQDNKTEYLVTQKGYGGNIKAQVVIENNKIVSIDIISNRETKDRYQLIIDNNYIESLINNQDNIESLDTISSATVTSNALKKLVTNVMEDYN